ncbi:VapC toxin family PIN domain ribonuclease, partial [Pseudomonas aeruginosa]|uniref:VapC toxin family PIN domain ribonuclease n=1 Tax=Pseudomonas aeruginosa TaxID=287 RepID=UPI000A3457B8
MKVAVDANVTVRAVVRDDRVQADVAAAVLTDAGLLAGAVACLCEFVWVLLRLCGVLQADAASQYASVPPAAKGEANRPALDAGRAAVGEGQALA